MVRCSLVRSVHRLSHRFLRKEPLQSLATSTQRLFSDDKNDPHHLFRQQMEELQAEREELFGFTPEDQVAWGNAPKDHKHSADFLSEIEQARKQAAVALEEVPQVPDAKLTHVSEDGKSVHMVNVGSKQVTKRRAVAEAKVIFPPDALEVLQAQQWTTAKGPIFDTAKISGIMATK